jgi:hypothetical protein
LIAKFGFTNKIPLAQAYKEFALTEDLNPWEHEQGMIIRVEIDRSISHGNIGHLNKCDVSYVYGLDERFLKIC